MLTVSSSLQGLKADVERTAKMLGSIMARNGIMRPEKSSPNRLHTLSGSEVSPRVISDDQTSGTHRVVREEMRTTSVDDMEWSVAPQLGSLPGVGLREGFLPSEEAVWEEEDEEEDGIPIRPTMETSLPWRCVFKAQHCPEVAKIVPDGGFLWSNTPVACHHPHTGTRFPGCFDRLRFESTNLVGLEEVTGVHKSIFTPGLPATMDLDEVYRFARSLEPQYLEFRYALTCWEDFALLKQDAFDDYISDVVAQESFVDVDTPPEVPREGDGIWCDSRQHDWEQLVHDERWFQSEGLSIPGTAAEALFVYRIYLEALGGDNCYDFSEQWNEWKHLTLETLRGTKAGVGHINGNPTGTGWWYESYLPYFMPLGKPAIPDDSAQALREAMAHRLERAQFMVQTCLMGLDCPKGVLLAMESQFSCVLVPAVALEHGHLGRRALWISREGAHLGYSKVEETEVEGDGVPFCTTTKKLNADTLIVVDDRRIVTWATGVTTAMIGAEDPHFVHEDAFDVDDGVLSVAKVSASRTSCTVEVSASDNSRVSSSRTTAMRTVGSKNVGVVRRRWRDEIDMWGGTGGKVGSQWMAVSGCGGLHRLG
jgi:hypothetical protein